MTKVWCVHQVMDSFTYTTLDVPAEQSQEPNRGDASLSPWELTQKDAGTVEGHLNAGTARPTVPCIPLEQSRESKQREVGLDFEKLREAAALFRGVVGAIKAAEANADDLSIDEIRAMEQLSNDVPCLIDMAERYEAAERSKDRAEQAFANLEIAVRCEREGWKAEREQIRVHANNEVCTWKYNAVQLGERLTTVEAERDRLRTELDWEKSNGHRLVGVADGVVEERDRLKAALYAPPGRQDYLSYTELRRRLVEAEQERTNAVCDRERLKTELAIEQTRSAAQLGSERVQSQMERNAIREERDRLKSELAALRSGNAGLSEEGWRTTLALLRTIANAGMEDASETLRTVITRLSARQPTLPWIQVVDGKRPDGLDDDELVVIIHEGVSCPGVVVTEEEAGDWDWDHHDKWIIRLDDLLATLPKEANS